MRRNENTTSITSSFWPSQSHSRIGDLCSRAPLTRSSYIPIILTYSIGGCCKEYRGGSQGKYWSCPKMMLRYVTSLADLTDELMRYRDAWDMIKGITTTKM